MPDPSCVKLWWVLLFTCHGQHLHRKAAAFAKKSIVRHYFQWKPSNWALMLSLFRWLLLLMLFVVIAEMWTQCYVLWISSTFFPRVGCGKDTKVTFNFLFRWYSKFAITMTGAVFPPESESCKYGFTFLWGESWRKYYLHVDSFGDGVESWEKAGGNVNCSVLLMFSFLQFYSAHLRGWSWLSAQIAQKGDGKCGAELQREIWDCLQIVEWGIGKKDGIKENRKDGWEDGDMLADGELHNGELGSWECEGEDDSTDFGTQSRWLGAGVSSPEWFPGRICVGELELRISGAEFNLSNWYFPIGIGRISMCESWDYLMWSYLWKNNDTIDTNHLSPVSSIILLKRIVRRCSEEDFSCKRMRGMLIGQGSLTLMYVIVLQ
jgi:hypothetical protein